MFLPVSLSVSPRCPIDAILGFAAMVTSVVYHTLQTLEGNNPQVYGKAFFLAGDESDVSPAQRTSPPFRSLLFSLDALFRLHVYDVLAGCLSVYLPMYLYMGIDRASGSCMPVYVGS